MGHQGITGGLFDARRELGGVWMAYYADRSACVPFMTEVDALRHAVTNGMQVRFARYGNEDWMTGEPDKPFQPHPLDSVPR